MLITIPLAVAIGVIFAPLAGVAVAGVGAVLALGWYYLAPKIMSRLQTQSYTQYFGEPIETRAGKESFTTTEQIRNEYDKKFRIFKVSLVNSAVMLPFMFVFTTA